MHHPAEKTVERASRLFISEGLQKKQARLVRQPSAFDQMTLIPL